MRLGIISDLHADVKSLEAALKLLDSVNVDEIVCCGDVVERGVDGDAVVRLLLERSILCVQGNHDENAIRHERLVANQGGQPGLTQATLAFLGELPMTRSLDLNGIRLLLAHAIPSDNGGAAFQGEGLRNLAKRFKKDLAKADVDVVAVGHTHYPFDVTFGDKWIINPGAVCHLQSRDSHTCGILDLSNLDFSVFDISTGAPIDLSATRTQKPTVG